MSTNFPFSEAYDFFYSTKDNTHTHTHKAMPSSSAKKIEKSIRLRSGRVVKFMAKPRRRSPRTMAELNKRLSKLKSPKMREAARAKWRQAHQ